MDQGKNLIEMDAICPVYWLEEDLFTLNIESWFREFPIKTLYLGVNNPEVVDVVKEICEEHEHIAYVDQLRFKTLGACLADLMKHVTLEWFVYAHADAFACAGCFTAMNGKMREEVGIIESARFQWRGKKEWDYPSYYMKDRAFSGIQIFQKNAMKEILKEIEDDYIYRNEDLIFQAACLSQGKEYWKTLGLHVHQTLNRKWTFERKKAFEMQWKGILKYTPPNAFCASALQILLKNINPLIKDVLSFVELENPPWKDVFLDIWDDQPIDLPETFLLKRDIPFPLVLEKELIMRAGEVHEDEVLKKILLIGPKGDSHFLGNLKPHLEEFAEVKHLWMEELTDLKISPRETTHVSRVLNKMEWMPNLILIDQDQYHWANRFGIPVFYNHREFYRNPTVDYPTAAFFWTDATLKFYERQAHPEWMRKVTHKRVLSPATNMDLFTNDLEKDSEEIIGIGGRESVESVFSINELTKMASMELILQEINEFKDLGFPYHDAPVSNSEYRELLVKAKGLWFPIPRRQYITRRMLDAMACKTLAIFKLENAEHEHELREMGFKNREHYLGIRELEELKDIDLSRREEIVENAYQVILEKHTFETRARQIKQLYYQLKNAM